MFGRPRCREWTPLTTQQLRLRSLIQIVGYNIRPPEACLVQCSFYLTLHHTTMSAPFYTSERISSPHPKWKEIDSEITHRMSSTNVVIRIWCHKIHPNKEKLESPADIIIQTWGVYFSGLRYIGANLASNFTSDCFKSNTLVFQMQGGYFCSYKSLKLDVIPPENEVEHGSLSSDSSGITSLSKIVLDPKSIQSSRLKEPRSISPNKYTRQLEKEYSKSHSPVDRGFKQNFPTLRTSASLNITQRPDNTGDRSNPQQIYEQKPKNTDVQEFMSVGNCDNVAKTLSNEDLSASNIDLSETAENYDLRSEGAIPKYRYLAINFLKSEIRQSYNATKLQRLHLLQYSIMKRQDAVQEIKENIYKKSAMCNADWTEPCFDSDSRIKFKNRSQRNIFTPDENEGKTHTENGKVKEDKPVVSNGPRLALKLNDLLSYKTKPSPFQRSEHIRLTKQIEILRFKKIILSDERDSKLVSLRKLKEKHAKLCEENQDVGLELMQSYHTLSRRNDSLKETRQSCDALRELAARSHSSMCSRRCELLRELLTVFHIEQQDASVWRIVNIPLPICSDDSAPVNAALDSVAASYIAQVTCIASVLDLLKLYQDASVWRIVNIPLPICSDDSAPVNAALDSVAASYIAQVTCIASVLLSQPLRYEIKLMGSATKIVDTMPVFNDHNIPLFVRSGDVTLFRYGLFLLNKCIAQLLWSRGVAVNDIGQTLANLYKLLSLPASLSETSKLFGTYQWVADSEYPRTQSLRSLVASEKKYRQFNRFKDAVDGQSPQNALNLRRHRHSRSVGSYNDDHEIQTLDTSTTCIMSSEPIIYSNQLTQENLELQQRLLKCQNNDHEIARLTKNIDNEKVTFTLGDENIGIESQTLVRISSNNDNVTCANCLGDNVKRICSEINDYCLSNSSNDFLDHHIQGPDINKLLEQKSGQKSGVEDVEVSNDSCHEDKDGDVSGVSQETNVTVKPSEEELDTEQGDS